MGKDCHKKCNTGCPTIVVLQKDAGQGSLTPAAAYTDAQVVQRSQAGAACADKAFKKALKALLCTLHAYENALYSANAELLPFFYDENFVYRSNVTAQNYQGIQQYYAQVLLPLRAAYSTVKVDFSTLNYAVHNPYAITAYGALTYTYTPRAPAGSAPGTVIPDVVVNAQVLITFVFEDGRWVFANQYLQNL